MVNNDGLFKIDNDNIAEIFNLCVLAWHLISDEIERSVAVGELYRASKFEEVVDTINNVRQIYGGKINLNIRFVEAYIPLTHMRVILKYSSTYLCM